jgi:tRNA(fMet)-specific endonuclease VapC
VTYLLDTNHAIAVLDADPRLTARLQSADAAGDRLAVSTTILGELYFGAYASQRRTGNLSRLAAFVSQLVVYDFDLAAAEEFGRIKSAQRAKGQPIPTADAQIAAVANVQGLTLLTDDAHFVGVDRLVMDNWLR